MFLQSHLVKKLNSQDVLSHMMIKFSQRGKEHNADKILFLYILNNFLNKLFTKIYIDTLGYFIAQMFFHI